MQPPSTKTLLLVMPANHPLGLPLAEMLQTLPFLVTLAETREVAAMCARYDVSIIVMDKNAVDDPLISAALKPLQGRLIPLLLEPMALPLGHWATAPIAAQATLEQTGTMLIERIRALPDQPPLMASAYNHYQGPRIPLPSERYHRQRFTGSGAIVLLAIAFLLLVLKSVLH